MISLKRLNEIVDEIYHMKRFIGLHCPGPSAGGMLQHGELLGNHSIVKNETGIFLPLLGFVRTQRRTIALELNSPIESTRNTLRPKPSNVAIFLV